MKKKLSIEQLENKGMFYETWFKEKYEMKRTWNN